HLPGFKPYDELPVYYGLARAFVHASTTEQWGLVVNEAVASGLPVIVSNRCGCVPELVQDNGFTFDPANESELAEWLLQMASLSADERRRLGEASFRIAANFAPDRFGEGLKQAAAVVLRLPRKKHGVINRALLLAAALLSSQIANTELEFIRSDVFNFKPADSGFDLVLCLGLIAHVGRLDILLSHLKSMLAPGGHIILQTTLTDHVGTRIVRALTARRELAKRGYRISWFSQREDRKSTR